MHYGASCTHGSTTSTTAACTYRASLHSREACQGGPTLDPETDAASGKLPYDSHSTHKNPSKAMKCGCTCCVACLDMKQGLRQAEQQKAACVLLASGVGSYDMAYGMHARQECTDITARGL